MTKKGPVPDRRPMFQQAYEPGEEAYEPGGPIAVAALVPIADGTGTLIGVRVQPELLKRLDAYRGGKTRPQAIRELLEENLP